MCIKRAARRVHCRARKGGKVGGRRFLIKKDWRGGSLLVSLFQPLYEYVCINTGKERNTRLMNRNGIATTVLINFNSDICQGWGWFSLCSSSDKKDCRRKKETHSFLHLFFFTSNIRRNISLLTIISRWREIKKKKWANELFFSREKYTFNPSPPYI